MAATAKIYWDEENSPLVFALLWVATQSAFLTLGLLIHYHLVDSFALMRNGNPAGERAFGFLVFVLTLSTIYIYLNLIVCGIWHRNPAALDKQNDDSEESDLLEGTSLHLNTQDDAKQHQPSSPPLFEQSIFKDPDPIVMRDQIQWKRIALATLGITTLVLTFAVAN